MVGLTDSAVSRHCSYVWFTWAIAHEVVRAEEIIQSLQTPVSDEIDIYLSLPRLAETGVGAERSDNIATQRPLALQPSFDECHSARSISAGCPERAHEPGHKSIQSGT